MICCKTGKNGEKSKMERDSKLCGVRRESAPFFCPGKKMNGPFADGGEFFDVFLNQRFDPGVISCDKLQRFLKDLCIGKNEFSKRCPQFRIAFRRGAGVGKIRNTRKESSVKAGGAGGRERTKYNIHSTDTQDRQAYQ